MVGDVPSGGVSMKALLMCVPSGRRRGRWRRPRWRCGARGRCRAAAASKLPEAFVKPIGGRGEVVVVVETTSGAARRFARVRPSRRSVTCGSHVHSAVADAAVLGDLERVRPVGRGEREEEVRPASARRPPRRSGARLPSTSLIGVGELARAVWWRPRGGSRAPAGRPSAVRRRGRAPGVVGVDQRGRRRLDEVLAVEDGAGAGVDERLVVGVARSAVKDVPGEPHRAGPAEEHEVRGGAGRGTRRARVARDDPPGPGRAQHRCDRRDREAVAGRAGERDDAAAAVDADREAIVERGHAAVPLRPADHGEPAARPRARGDEGPEVAGVEPERRRVRADVAPRDRRGRPRRGAGEGAAEAEELARRVGQGVELEPRPGAEGAGGAGRRGDGRRRGRAVRRAGVVERPRGLGRARQREREHDRQGDSRARHTRH